MTYSRTMSTVSSVVAEMVPAKTAATLLGVSKWTITRWCRIGRIPGAVQPGLAWRVPLAAVQTLLTPPTSEASR